MKHIRSAVLALIASLTPASVWAEETIAAFWKVSFGFGPDRESSVSVDILETGTVTIIHCLVDYYDNQWCSTDSELADPARIEALVAAVSEADLVTKPPKAASDNTVEATYGYSVLVGQELVGLPVSPAEEDEERVFRLHEAVYSAIPQRLLREYVER